MKKFLLVLVVFGIAAVLSGCGLKAPSEEELKAMIPQEILTYYLDDNEYLSSVSQLEITRRQTNEKDDYAECVVDLIDNNLNRRVYISFTTKYYDKGGWMLESWNIYKNEEYKATDNSYDTDLLKQQGFDICMSICSTEGSGVKKVSETKGENCVKMLFEIFSQNNYWSASGEVVGTAFLTTNDDYKYPKQYIWNTEFDFSSVDEEWNIMGTWHGTPSSENMLAPDTNYDVSIRINSLEIVSSDGQIEGVINLDISGTRYFMGGTNSITTDGKPVNMDVNVRIHKFDPKYDYEVVDYGYGPQTNITLPYLSFDINELFYITFGPYSGSISAKSPTLGPGSDYSLTRFED